MATILTVAAMALFLWEPARRTEPLATGGVMDGQDGEARVRLEASTPAARTSAPKAPAAATKRPPASDNSLAAGTATVAGTVVDDRGAPIVGALVQVVGVAGPPTAPSSTPASAATAATGRPAAGQVSAFSVPPTPGGNLGVTPGAVPAIPYRQVEGDGLAGVAGALRVQSGSDGRFRLRQVPAGTVQVAASAPGFTSGRTRSLTVAAGEMVGNLELVLRPSAGSSARAVDETPRVESQLPGRQAR